MRAILLAAGMGTRLRPLTLDTPKSLVKVLGEPMMERQIEFLKEKGIDEIIVVTGYLNDKFNYLVDKYGVKLIHNKEYNKYNNIYTMYLVREYLEDAYVIDADVYIKNNMFEANPEISKYYSAKKTGFSNEWIIIHDGKNRVVDIEVGTKESAYILSGVSFWTKKSGEYIKRKLEEAVEERDFSNLYWDDIVRENLKELEIYIEKIGTNDIFEVDTLEDYNNLNELLISSNK
ncbi:sugar phosphate nucleotidyltransferase [Clostridium paridis]|uniref:NTP transferase domain-containing protein n=1 Tax=Clostridium paridis TaxID=2803863 RepID=A0A937FG94_9CLOT|nr:sugar phosphate nucleotidyltransferase [Clostridium paridis]MBL4932618.1 NTP transferase domain-containing protein [Clostridium paridis]